MNSLKFRLAAKTDIGLVRTNNEDNFQAASDLSSGKMTWVNNEICSLGDKGALLTVADGMGGMNAGEVASEIAIETVREYFSVEKLNSDITKDRYSIEKYMNDVIVAADDRIKQVAKERPETQGMGTTIVLGWIYEGKLYISWCGDSRAYIYNPQAGLHQITKDHSYVQGLVDKGVLSRKEAFDYPESNIITNSLTDGRVKAKPESLLKPYELCDNDIILLCTDGLCGMIRDNEIEAVIRSNEHNMDTLVNELIHAACEAEGSDNITICICQIIQGGAVCNPAVFEKTESRLNGVGRRNSSYSSPTIITNNPLRKKSLFLILGLCLILVVGGLSFWYFKKHSTVQRTEETSAPKKPNGSTPVVGVVKAKEGEDFPQYPADNDTFQQVSTTPESTKGNLFNDIITRNINNPNSFATTNPDTSANLDTTTMNNSLTSTGNRIDKIDSEDSEEQEVEETIPYQVQENDKYYKLAKKFGIKKEDLQKMNNYKELITGDTILVPKQNKRQGWKGTLL